ncbi:MAG: putative RRD2-activator of the phosphotyrosyl phosphatase activity of PP2A [Olpidium bornovanus]|uniref:Serine/threonine-protein phosphatase 2A activator n=1 Tax=Olpidium bornovanus TaxID=278681 RepID=A0A8H7ZQZ7_9FUNG|nr:MAG: putative RRD2-activator of the phosphotyrosyl phosphatase activity of PP2A [Olpidium bornovanus]
MTDSAVGEDTAPQLAQKQSPGDQNEPDGAESAWGPPPRRQILTKADLENFHKSETYQRFVGFVQHLNDAVVGKSLKLPCYVSKNVEKILEIIAEVGKIADDTPPTADHTGRFGNPAFRLFYDKLSKAAPFLHEGFVQTEKINEISRYFIDSFGNRRRIDYGTGHEANFATWLLCLEIVGLIKPEDYEAVVLRIFHAYLNLMRKLQFAYWLEPAGSHGVWGLDDYHFLPFMFGSAQLRGTKMVVFAV